MDDRLDGQAPQRASEMTRGRDEPALVSVIMPTHNSARFVDEAIQSVIAQSWKTWELIIVDDCSSDETVAVIDMYCRKENRIRFIILSENAGSAVARNKAISAAKGRYIAFLDSDDVWAPNKLETQIGFMAATGCPFTYASYERISESGERISLVSVPDQITYRSLLKKNVIACLTAVYDTHYFGKTLMPNIRKGQDYGLWLTLLKRVDIARAIPHVLGKYRLRESSISSNKFESSQWVWKIYREVGKLGVLRATYYFAFYATSGVWSRIVEKRAGAAATLQHRLGRPRFRAR